MRLTSTSLLSPWRTLFDPSEKQKLLLSQSGEGLTEGIVLLFDTKFFLLAPHASCCPLYSHENKGLNSPVIPLPSVLCSSSLAGDLLCCWNLFEFSCQDFRDVCAALAEAEAQRQLPALQKKSSGVGAGRRREP